MKRVLLVLLLWCPAVATYAVQHEGHQMAPARPTPPPPPTPNPEKVLGWEPIRCWRQTSAGAVSVGESFTVVLTCAVYEADNAQVVPDESRLNVASIQLAPFEILGGSHPPDVHRGSRRFFQYDYQLRIISPDAMGHDVNVPPLPISYRIHSRVGAAATLEGRDLSYLLPMMPIKILSLVPNDASDIRDASDASLAAVDSLRFRSSLFRVLTIVFGALAAVMAVLAFVPLMRSRTAVATAEPDHAHDRIVLAAVSADLDEVGKQANIDGWTDEVVARALADTRVVASAAIGTPVSQKLIANGAKTPDGRLRVQHGLIKAVATSVSSAVTPDDVSRAARESDGLSTTRRQQLDGLQSGMTALTQALYRKEPARDGAVLDEAVQHAKRVAGEIARERNWWSGWARR